MPVCSPPKSWPYFWPAWLRKAYPAVLLKKCCKLLQIRTWRHVDLWQAADTNVTSAINHSCSFCCTFELMSIVPSTCADAVTCKSLSVMEPD